MARPRNNGAWEMTDGATSGGTRQAYERLVRPCLPSLYRTALRMTGDAPAAEDLVQDACLKAYCGFDRFQKGTNFKAWLFRIMTNRFIDTKRGAARAPALDPRDVDVDTITGIDSTTHGNPEIHVLYKTFRSEAFRAMDTLPPDIRAVVALSLLREFSYQEIADVVGCPIGTVRSRLSRGREQLRDRLMDFVPSSAGIARNAPRGKES